MNSSQRRNLIKSQLEMRGRVSVVDLAAQFGVAQETIRRDLAKLDQTGDVRKVHGGAVNAQNRFEDTLVSRLTQHIPEKHKLAKFAAKLIVPGSTLFIDFGTTTKIFVELISQLSDLTIITNSHEIADAFTGNSSCDAYVLGGKYNGNLKSNSGPLVVDGIQQFYADFTVVGTGGIDPEIGFTLQDINEATTAKAMIARGTKVIVLADPSKFNRRGIAHMANFNQVDYLVSSEAPSKDLCDALNTNKVELMTSNGASLAPSNSQDDI